HGVGGHGRQHGPGVEGPLEGQHQWLGRRDRSIGSHYASPPVPSIVAGPERVSTLKSANSESVSSAIAIPMVSSPTAVAVTPTSAVRLAPPKPAAEIWKPIALSACSRPTRPGVRLINEA